MGFSATDVTAELGLAGQVQAFELIEDADAGTGGTHTFPTAFAAQPQAYWTAVSPKANLTAVRASGWLVQVTPTDIVAQALNAANSGDAAPQLILFVVEKWSTILRNKLRDVLIAAATVQAARG